MKGFIRFISLFIISLAIAFTAMADYDNSEDILPYAATGYTAQGTMEISSELPEGKLPIGLIEVEEPVITIPQYYSYERLCTDIVLLKKAYPGLLNCRILGASTDGRNLFDLYVGNPDAGTQIMLNGSIHGREYITSNLCMLQLEYFLACVKEGAFDGKSMEEWLEEVCVHFVPMIDPDGVSVSIYGKNGIRKTVLRDGLVEIYQNDRASGKAGTDMTSYFRQWKANARGVNLNENFVTRFYELKNVSKLPSAFNYKGAYPHSEAETKIMSDLSVQIHFKAVVNYHATGSLIYWDIGNNKLREHCRDLANNVSALTGYPLKISDDGGGYNDFLKTKTRPTTSISVEVGKGQAPVSSSELAGIYALNKLVPFYVMKWAYDMGL